MLDARRLMSALASSTWVRQVTVVPCSGSTNDEARAMAALGAPDGTIVIAERQSAGRGRMGRSWHSPEGAGLYLSVLLRPGEPIERIGRYGLAAATAACATCRTFAGDDVRIKWPNDLLARGGKVGGVLAEVRSGQSGIELVVGLGININHGPDEFPPELRGVATSLRILRDGRPIDREIFTVHLLESLGAELADLRHGSWGRVAERFLRYAPHAEGARVRLAAGGYGTTRGLDPSGALRVATGDAMVLVHASESVSVVEG